MDEKLRAQIKDLICPLFVLSDPEAYLNDAVTEIEQAFREAGWHPRSECLKHIDLETIPCTPWGLPGERQACIDWLKQQVR